MHVFIGCIHKLDICKNLGKTNLFVREVHRLPLLIILNASCLFVMLILCLQFFLRC